MRSWTRMLCALLVGAACLYAGAAVCLAGDDDALKTPLGAQEAGERREAASQDAAPAVPPPTLTVKNAILIERTTGQALFETGADERRAPASITKIMTMLLVLEALDAGEIALDEPVTCSEYASSMGGSQIWLEPYEQMTVHELLKATAVASANDAATALAEHVAGSETAFVEAMNRRAVELGCENTHFINCTGLDEAEHFTSARDIAVMARALLEHPLILEYTGIWMDELRGGQTQLVNTNKLIYHYPGATGLKTGSTDNAGRCLCASAGREGMDLISVVLGAENSDMQFGDSRALLDWGFAHYVSVPVELPPGALAPLPVAHGVSQAAELCAEGPKAVVVGRGEEERIVYDVTLETGLTAPVAPGRSVGRVTVRVDGEGGREIASFPVTARDGVERLTFPRALARLLHSLVSSAGTAPAQEDAPAGSGAEGAGASAPGASAAPQAEASQ